MVGDRGCQSLAEDPVRAVEVRLPAGLCTSTVGSDIEVQHLRRNSGPVMAIALSVEQSRIGQRVDAVVTGHGGAVRRPFRDAGTATVQIICCHSIPLPFERCDAATSLHQVGVTTTTLHGLPIILM